MSEDHRPDADPLLVFRRRADLLFEPGSIGGRNVWTIKDPLSLNYFNVGEQEHALLQQLDGSPLRLSEIVEGVRRQCPGEDLSPGNAIQYLQQLLAAGLIRLCGTGQGDRIDQIRTKRQKKDRFARLMRILSTRFPGVNPRPLLNAIEPLTRVLLSPIILLLGLSIVLWATVLVTLRFEEVVSRLPTLNSLIAPQNLMWVALAVVAVKLCHELGHAVVCNHLKADCHEFGIMLLVMFPVFYCNVSDSWTLKPWKRMAIAAAGIVTELFIAAVCTLLWWFSSPGPLNAFLLNLMIVCSIGTIAFNANPLLRFDGYFMMQDGLNIPNLGQQSQGLVRRIFDLAVFGSAVDESPDVSPSRWWFLVTYGIASTVYRVFISVFILVFLRQLFVSQNLEILFSILCLPMLFGIVVVPVVGFVNRFRRTLKNEDLQSRRRSQIGCGVFAVSVLTLFLFPFPLSVCAPCVIQPADAKAVYVVVPGQIEASVSPWQTVEEGDTVAKLGNPELESEFERLTGRVAELQTQFDNLNLRRGQDESIRFSLPATETALESAKERLVRVARERGRLTITSPTSGEVLPPPNRVATAERRTNWKGRPTDPVNQGAWLDAATMVCSVGNRDMVEAVVVVSQDSIQQIKVGHAVEVQLMSAPSSTIVGKVTEIARNSQDTIPREIVAAGLIAAPQPGVGADVLYQVRIQLNSTNAVGLYYPGWARIEGLKTSLSARLYRAIRQAFDGGGR